MTTEDAAGGQLAKDAPKLPETSAFDIKNGAGMRPEDGEERNAVFESLVTADGDIVGLVAYSIYKQNKHDWLIAFDKQKGRPPNEGEQSAYIVGESTPRRLAIYRHLAEATLEGRGPEVPAGPSTEAFAQRAYGAAVRRTPARSGGGKGASILTWIGLLIVFVGAVLVAARYGIPGVTPPPR